MPKKRTEEEAARELIERQGIAERLVQAREAAKYKTATEAAEAMGVHYGTYAGHENANRSISRAMLSRYAKFYGVKADFLLYGSEHGAEEDSVKLSQAVAEFPKLRIVGTLSGDLWKDSDVPFVDRVSPFGPVNGFSGSQVLYEMLDASFNEEALPGSFVVCLLTDSVREGDCVIVERREGNRSATTARSIGVRPDGTFTFHFKSSQPSFSGAEPLHAGPDVRIIGRIIGTFRRI
jgi:transcriptional regulator with XRE-family HTH domain